MNNTTQKNKWQSNGATISKSRHHSDLYIVDHNNGTFHSVSSTQEIMLKKYPEGRFVKQKRRVLVTGNEGVINFAKAI